MARAERPLDPANHPLHAFAAELRQLRDLAGKPTYTAMARATNRSRTALSEAAGGDQVPKWDTVAAYVTACGGDPAEWEERWRALAFPVTVPDPDPGPDPEPVPVRERPAARRGPRLLPVGLFVAGLCLGGGATWLLTGDGSESPAAASGEPVPAAVITVQNMVAQGPDQLIEDATPSFLSTTTQPYCANADCKLGGSEAATGAKFVAVCQVTGTEMFNYNLDSSESRNNPHRASSSLWYMAKLPDGRAGYISEVYIAPEDRGGKGLPECPEP